MEYEGKEPIELRGVVIGRLPSVGLVRDEDDMGYGSVYTFTDKGPNSTFYIHAMGLMAEPYDYNGNPYPNSFLYVRPFAIARGKVAYGDAVAFQLQQADIQ